MSSGMIFDASELAAYGASLAGKPGRLGTLASQVVRKAGLDGVNIMKREVPVDTGALRNSVGMSVVDETSVEIGPTVYYAPYVCYGHHTRSGSMTAPNRFDQRTVDSIEPSFRQAAAAIGEAIL